MQDASRSGSDEGGDELSIKLLYGGVVVGGIVLVAVAFAAAPGMTLVRAILMSLLGMLWIWAAGVIVSECLGRTNWSPLSGMTLIAVTILILIGSGLGDTTTIITSVVVGAAICVAIAQAGDMMVDLKSGYLVGATPRRQQIAQVAATWLGPILVMGLIYILHDAYTLGSERLPAPQGTALASVIDGIIGGNVPAYRYGAGAGLGLLLATSGLGGIGVLVGLGFYMPFHIVLTYTVGNLVRIWADAKKGRHWVENEAIPVAAGLIVGEALAGVGNAMIAVIAGMGG